MSMTTPQEQFTAADRHWMEQAIELARRGLYTTRTNPRVGCVLVRGGQVIGEGYHERPGEGHAEVQALRNAAGHVRGATAYVTLEPCSHFGRTPPCASALIEAGVRRVVTASGDPNPQVNGRGLAILREAGVQTACGLMSEAAEALNPGFFKRMRQGLPFVRLKMAISLDGRTALANGDSQWLTGPQARHDVQRWRARSCAILTGAYTVLADNPSLTVRIGLNGEPCAPESTTIAQPLRVIVDGKRRVGTGAKLFSLPGATAIATVRQPPPTQPPAQPDGVHIWTLPAEHGHPSLPALMRRLSAEGINEVHTECGPQLAGALLQAGLADELLLYMAPHLLGHGARGLANIAPVSDMAQRPEFDIIDVTQLGPDLRIRATCKAAIGKHPHTAV